MKKEYIVELSEKEADKLMDEHWVGELVRCLDCWKRTYDNCPFYEHIGFKPEDDWFCADGERRTDNVLYNSKC